MNFYTMFTVYLAAGLAAGFFGRFFLGLDELGTGLLCLGVFCIIEGLKKVYAARKNN